MIPLAVPNLTGNEKKYLDNCIDTTFVSSVGEYVNRFEKMVAKATGSRYAVATSSGTTGLHVALTAVGVRYNELIIIPTFTFIASANAVRHCGADTWLIDISPNDWCLDPKLVRDAIESKCEKRAEGLFHIETGKRIAALMPVYTLGNIPDMRELRKIANEYDIPLVVDAACAIGATYMNKPFGGLADISVLSFNGNKTVTCGGGGAVVGNDKHLLEHIQHLTTTARVWPDYDFDEVGFNYRMTNIQAAVGCAQLERLDEFVEKKRYIREYYNRHFTCLESKGITQFPTPNESSCWYSGIILPKGSSLDDSRAICTKLKERGIESRLFWKPVHLQKPYNGSPAEDTQTAESIWERIITLPCSTGMTETEMEIVKDSILDIV